MVDCTRFGEMQNLFKDKNVKLTENQLIVIKKYQLHLLTWLRLLYVIKKMKSKGSRKGNHSKTKMLQIGIIKGS
jgi:hypothetical protein